MLNQAWRLTSELITEHWLKLLWFPIAAAIVWWWKRRRDLRSWKSRQFLQRVNCSLNFVEIGVLKIRTLFEVPLDAILLNNSAMQEVVLKAAQRTTTGDAFITLPDGDDNWHFLNAGLNEVAERFADGTLAADMGLPVERAWYVLGWTCERDADVRVRKLRLMVVKEDLLCRIGSGMEQPAFEHSSHKVRWKTLEVMSEYHLRGKLMRIEIVRPVAALPQRAPVVAAPTPVEVAL